jgi:hypothetical protein
MSVATKSLQITWNSQIMINYLQQDRILWKQIFKIWNFKIIKDLHEGHLLQKIQQARIISFYTVELRMSKTNEQITTKL